MRNSVYIFNIPSAPEEHQHSFPQLVLGSDGNSKIEIEGNEVLLNRQKGCIISPQTRHSSVGMGINTSITINFTQPILDDFLKRLMDEPRVFPIDQSMRKFIQFASMELPTYEGSANIGHDRFSQNIIDVFKELLVDRIVQKSDLHQIIDLEVIDHYLDERLHEKICVEDLARLVATSPSHFFSLFKKENDISPHQYIIKKRIERAKHLLQTTTLSIVEVSQETGFSSQSALNNTFKAQFGITPGKIRKEVQ